MFELFGNNAFTLVFGIMVLTSLFGMYLLNDSR
jgi:hypothetical protein